LGQHSLAKKQHCQQALRLNLQIPLQNIEQKIDRFNKYTKLGLQIIISFPTKKNGEHSFGSSCARKYVLFFELPQIPLFPKLSSERTGTGKPFHC
jgi:hypothetical protein